MSRAAAEVGSTANSYQILAKLATGGMAEIFLARGEGVAGVERYCVLKRILRDRATDVHFVQMFLDEARLAAQLQHANIAQVYDIGKLGDSYFFTMEYVHGETVRALLHRAQGLRRTLPIHSVLTIVAGAAAGLHHAHDRVGLDGRALSIVHRDVSPSNLMVSYEGGVKLVDFGVAKASDRAQETKSGTVKGKISYLSPEQCRGKRVDRRSDLFSLGICFWEMLTTERLYRRASDFENMNAIVVEPPPSPSSRRDDVPPEIDELVLRLLAKDAGERFQTAEELIEAIEAVASRTGLVLSASGLGRFVRELFGQRPEPWLELENLQEHGEAITVTSEPIPPELVISPAERVDHQLSSVVDLSSPRSITESLDQVHGEVPTAQIGKPSKPAKRGFPLAAPPPTHPGIDSTTAPAPTGPSPAVPPPPPGRTTGPSPVVPPLSSMRTTGPSPLVSPPSSDSFTPSGELVLPPPPVPPSGPRAAPPPLLAAAGPPATGSPAASPAALGPPAAGSSASFAAAAVPAPGSSASFSAPGRSAATLSGSQVTPSGTLAALAGPTSDARATPRRVGWPLYAVIGGAALIGSIAMMIMMPPRSDAPAAEVAKAVDPRRSSITVEPIEPATGTPPGPSSGSGAPGGSLAVQHAVELGSGAAVEAGSSVAAPGAGAAAEAGPAVAAEANSRTITGRGREVAGHGAGPRAGSAAGPPPPTAGTRGAPRAMSLATGRAPGKREGRPDDIPRLYAAAQYDKVVATCSDGPVSAEHAPHCFLAACHVGDDATARRLITAVPAARRDLLTMNCRQLGVDIKKADCEADPMACQH